MELVHQLYSWVTRSDYELVAGTDWPNWESFQDGQNVPGSVYRELDDMLSQDTEFKSKSFCVLPFYGREYPSNSVCCLLTSDANLDKIKKDIGKAGRDHCTETIIQQRPRRMFAA